ncbi:MAG: ATP-binding protein [Sneathiella sp.]
MRNPFNTIAGRLVLLLASAVLISQIFLFVMFLDLTEDRALEYEDHFIFQKTGSVYRSIQSLPEEEQLRLMETAGSVDTFFFITDEPAAGNVPLKHEEFEVLFLKELGKKNITYRNKATSEDFFLQFWFESSDELCFYTQVDEQIPENCPYRIFSIEMENGKWLNLRTNPELEEGVLLIPVVFSAILSLLGVTLMSWIAVKKIMRPLAVLTDAVERFGRGEEVAPLDTSAARELSSTIQTFNDMQERLGRFIRDRTRMLASISHDLRTPITSLRIRTEFVTDPDLQGKMVQTLEDMQTMVEASLAFARQESFEEASQEIDLIEILQTLSTDIPDVEFSCELASFSYLCRPVSLKRAIRNLLDNAVQYGERAVVSLSQTLSDIEIVIRDYGPGVPEDDLDQIFEPFVRLDKARNTETGNVGLGLSIARTIIHNHGGKIKASAGKPGLKVTITLPTH